MDEKTTSTLTEVLQKTSPDNIAEYFFENEKYILKTDKPFAAYMRSMFKRKGIKQQDVFLGLFGYSCGLKMASSLTAARA